MFQLSSEESEDWRSQIVISNEGWLLRSQRTVEVNIAIVRPFVKLRPMLATNEELARMVAKHDRQITVLFEHVQKMLAPHPECGRTIGEQGERTVDTPRPSFKRLAPESETRG